MAFQRTLMCLRLRFFSVTANAVVTLVNYFPNLAHLYLDDLSHEVDDRPIPPFSRPLQKLTVDQFTSGGLALLHQLMGLHPQCDKITFEQMWSSCPPLAQCVINGVEASIKRLDLKSALVGASYV